MYPVAGCNLPYLCKFLDCIHDESLKQVSRKLYLRDGEFPFKLASNPFDVDEKQAVSSAATYLFMSYKISCTPAPSGILTLSHVLLKECR